MTAFAPKFTWPREAPSLDCYLGYLAWLLALDGDAVFEAGRESEAS